MKNQSCKFAKWLGKNGCKCISNSGKLWEKPHNAKKPKKGVYVALVEELYDEFLKN